MDDLSDLREWAEMHGYTQKCLNCRQTTDSDFCSTICELDYIQKEAFDENEAESD